MKLYKYYLLIASAFCLFACENEMDDLSRETVPCEIVLDGAKTVLVEMGNPYIDPGYEAFQGNIDVTEDVIVSGTLDINTAGKYTLRYTVKNSDGVSTIEKRTVIVFDPVSPSGFYKVSKDSYRNAPPTKEYESEPTVLIYQEESGAYYISDLFGGFYDVGRGYGSRYAVGGAVNISRKGKISLARSDVTPWGDKFSKAEGTYDEATQTFEMNIEWEAGYTFHLILIKQSL